MKTVNEFIESGYKIVRIGRNGMIKHKMVSNSWIRKNITDGDIRALLKTGMMVRSMKKLTGYTYHIYKIIY